MTEIVPFDFSGTSVRVVRMDGEPWFVASDVCAVLGYVNGRASVGQHVPVRHQGSVAIYDGTPGNPNRTIISESGLYRLIMRSNSLHAEPFQDWVTDEVLPRVRQTGSYSVQHALPQTFAEALRELATTFEAKELAEARAAELEPAANSWNTLADDGGDYSLRAAAQVLDRDPAISTGQNRLSTYLKELGWLDKHGQPIQHHVNCGRVVLRATGGYDRSDGQHVATWQPRITVKGLHELHQLLGGTGALLLSA